ncbi:hypothetical protein [Peribacillus sp. SCS-155]|uniref:hypothetical protein n=1 Tax=Peribacillus sedimenti TaxID=3115297 RepID=UPI0039057768
MNKILFLQNKDKPLILQQINSSLETKNRLLKLIITNPDKKTSITVSREKRFRYEEQIMMLEKIKDMVISCNSRDQLKKINSMIEYYNSLSQ